MSEPPKKACPFCGEEILAVAVKCRHCREDLAPAEQPTMPAGKRGWPDVILYGVLAVFLIPIALGLLLSATWEGVGILFGVIWAALLGYALMLGILCARKYLKKK